MPRSESCSKGAGVRAAAAEVAAAVVRRGRSLEAALSAVEAMPVAADRALLRNLAYGTLRRQFRLAEWRRALVMRPLKPRDRIVESLIDVGLFQLVGTRIPDHAAVSATVAAARLLGRGAFAGLVNAALRRFLREGMVERAPVSRSARYDHPDWLIDRLQGDWGDAAAAILKANNTQAPMWLRVNTARNGVEVYLARLAAAGIGYSRLAGLPDAVRLDEPVPTADLPGFADGGVSVQDGAAQLAARWLLTGGGGRALDACAAPGGKTAHLLEIGAEVDAVDIDAQRLASLRDNLDRLGFDARLYRADAAAEPLWWDGEPYHRILLDAPCSASGVIRRHPDIKLLRREADLPRLATQQRALLARLWTLLAPGGRLLYVTCSVLRAENRAVVEDFLAATPDARRDPQLPDNNIRALMRPEGPGYQILPGPLGLDGFFFAPLVKA